MASEWQGTTLAEVVEFSAGHRNSQDSVARGEYPFFTCSREILRHSEFDFDTEAVIMAGNNADARFHLQYFNGRFAARQRTYIIRPKSPELDCRFLFYALHGLQPLFAAQAQGTTTKFVTIGILRNAPIYLPPLPEQRAIAHILGTLDDKIKLNRRMSETLESIARALFQSWFVDFDPVRAKSEGRDTGLPKHVADLFPASLEESELGPIPTGWRVGQLADLLSLDKGLSYKGQFLGDTGVPMVNLGCFLGRGRFDADAVKFYTGDFQPRHTIRAGDLVLANTDITQKREVLGSPGIVPSISGIEHLIFSHHVFAMRFHDDAQDWRLFTFFALQRENFRERATGFATGTTVLALPRDAVLEHRIAKAPSNLIETFNRVIVGLLKRASACREQSDTIETLRDALLPRLVTGELPLPGTHGILEGSSR